jgi:hypothetical protein
MISAVLESSHGGTLVFHLPLPPVCYTITPQDQETLADSKTLWSKPDTWRAAF